MSNSVEHKGFLIYSDPIPRGELGWGAKVSLVNTATVPAVATSPIIWERTYATHEEAYQAGIDAAIQGIDAGGLP
jgi:hypothetical protein